jgi:hypothetical protein
MFLKIKWKVLEPLIPEKTNIDTLMEKNRGNTNRIRR